MPEEQNPTNQPIQPSLPLNPQQPQHGVLNMTLGQLLQGNPTAQNMVMQSMQVTPQQFQQLLGMTGNNQLMNTTIGDLFKNGTITQAMQITPQQLQQMTGTLNNPNQSTPLQSLPMQPSQPVNPSLQMVSPPQPKPSFLQKLKNLFS